MSDKKTGRPSKYNESLNDIALKLCKLGAKDTELAEFFEVDEATINRWKTEHPTFHESLKMGKMLADSEVAEKLYKQAIGYEREEVEYKVVAKGNNAGSEIQAVPVKRFYKPDTIAQIFWLKNRQPKWWRDKIETDTGDKAPILWNETKTYKGDKPKKK